MTHPRLFPSFGAVLLVPLLISCGADGTAPDDDVPEVVTDRMIVRIRYIDVFHDCDPAPDNPGDFQSWVEIWQDTGTGSDARLLHASPKDNRAFNSGERGPAGLLASARIERVPGRMVRVYAFVRELDNGIVDAAGDQIRELTWSLERNCWMTQASCLPITAGGGSPEFSWITSVRAREDVHILFNPDDEGCAFDVNYEAFITDS